ncbi:MAG: acyl-CoA reductase [Flammeovirgaceae bacterium]
MTVAQRIQAFEKLYSALKALDQETREFWSRKAVAHNGWFQGNSVALAIDGLIRYLEPTSFRAWAASYALPTDLEPKKVGVIMAGNIPMVGIHDFITVLLSGHELHAKLSSQDPFLIKEIANMLIEIEPAFEQKIHFVERMNDVHALIATGSDNSARYFEYYFKDKPKIIRKNRTSVAVLTGQESEAGLQKLAEDILAYYGLGCRNVSKIFIPKDYELTQLMAASEALTQENLQNHKYSNNYDYHKSIYLVNQIAHLDNGGLLATEMEELVSPIAVLYYEYYEDEAALKGRLADLTDKIQCIVSDGGHFPNSLTFGQAQEPKINDYADGVDTLKFLLEI